MHDIIRLIYGDQRINAYETMVSGSDLCDMCGLFFDLAESLNFKWQKNVEALEKYKIAYNNKVRRDKRAKEKGEDDENDPKLKTIREANTKLMQEKEELHTELVE